MQSNFFKLNLQDLGKGAVTAVIGAVLVTIVGVFQTPGFDLFSADWSGILTSAGDAGFTAFSAYLVKNLFSDSQGKFMGKI